MVALAAIFPWTHNARDLSHQEIVFFVKSLPSYSRLAIEMTPTYLSRILAELQSMAQLSEPERLAKFSLSASSPAAAWQHLAFLEVVLEADLRNIRLYSIDHDGYAAEREEARKKGDFKKMIGLDEMREQVFAEALAELLPSKKKGTIPALIGIGHVHELEKKLHAKKIPTQLNISIREQAAMQEIIQKDQQIRARVSQNKIRQAIVALTEMRQKMQQLQSRPETLSAGAIGQHLNQRLIAWVQATAARDPRGSEKPRKTGFGERLRRAFKSRSGKRPR